MTTTSTASQAATSTASQAGTSTASQAGTSTASQAGGKPELLTCAQAAALLDVSPDTLTRWARNGTITATRTPGGRSRYSRAEILYFQATRPAIPRPSPRRKPAPGAAAARRGEAIRRADAEALRIRMAARGADRAAIAAQLRRRYGLRPRRAWRYAAGLSLTGAALACNQFTARAGLDPDGRAPFSGSHLSDHEAWPGPGPVPAPAGRKPGLYLLTILAAVYGCAPADLIDIADRNAMTPADLLLIDNCAFRHPARLKLPADRARHSP